MELKDYFAKVNGLGVLSTANKDGIVDSAVYTKPYFMDDGKIAFIMRDKLTHANLKENPHAAYLFKENSDRYEGRRLFLKKFDESDDEALINKVKQQSSHAQSNISMNLEKMFLILFDIQKVLPLIGEK